MNDQVEQEQRYRCVCQHELRVFGRERHHVYFAISDTTFPAPVTSGARRGCRRPLPGKRGT